MTEEMSASLQKGLSEWWSEETEYIFQRIERWAAFARGYNRLRSQRLSRGRLTMQEEQEPRWTISSNKIVIEDSTWNPRFHNLKRSHRRKSRADENCKINCCGTFNYQSNSNLDSTCLETYRYDHSIYFKTIGDIKSSKKDLTTTKSEIDDVSCCSDEQIEWEAKTAPVYHDDRRNDYDEPEEEIPINNNDSFRLEYNKFETTLDDHENHVDEEDQEINRILHNSWPIADFKNLSTEVNERSTNNIETDDYDLDNDMQDICLDDHTDDNNNNCREESVDSTQKMIKLQIDELGLRQNLLQSSTNLTIPSNSHRDCQEDFTRVNLSTRKKRHGLRKVRQPPVVGDNNILWPGVLLNYTKNIDPSTSPHHCAVYVK